ncbi:hypothetical protein ACOMHN_059180 [Nucella lapillus]
MTDRRSSRKSDTLDDPKVHKQIRKISNTKPPPHTASWGENLAIPWNFTLNVNLQEGAVQQLDFLQEVFAQPALDDEKVLKHSIFRYENYWLPLAGKHPNETLAAPLDVEWIWLCHMLSPIHYQKDCNSLVGRVVSHKLYSAMQRRKQQQKARSLWQVEYPREPFNMELNGDLFYTDDDLPSRLSLDLLTAAVRQKVFFYQVGRGEGIVCVGEGRDEGGCERLCVCVCDDLPSRLCFDLLSAAVCRKSSSSRLCFDLLSAAVRQKVFFYQVSLPHFKDLQFLSICELRYKRFLYLKQQNPSVELVPCYDMDLMWHTHMLHPLAYKIDTETILGFTLDHNKFLDGPNPELHLTEAYDQTRDLWTDTFDESVNFEVCGSTYRGVCTVGKLHALTPQQNFMASTKTATFIIEKVDVQGLPALKGKLVFKLYTGLNGKIGKCAATFKGEPPWQGKNVPETDFETDTVNYLKIRVIDQIGMLACFGSREIVGEKDIDLRPTLDSLTHETSVEHSVSLSQVYGATVAAVTTHFCWPQRGPVHLYLRVGIFTSSSVPEKPETAFAHVPIRKPPTGIENTTYLMAQHSFVNHSESVVLTCRVLHSVDLLQSAIYVFYQDKMAAAAHLVGLDQLPLPTQISDPRKVPYLNPRAGERGVLIKNSSGDWAVVIGRWTAVRKGGSRMGSRRGKDGLPGQLLIRVREMEDFGWRELQLTYTEQHWRFTLDDLHADLKEGIIRIDNPESQHIAEKVALTFSVALLHVLCMPRPSGWRRGNSLRPRHSRRSTRSSKWIPSDEMPFILAAGVLQDTPTNGYIRQTHGLNGWTSDREGLLGPANSDLMTCRPEDGLGGIWASVTPGLNELYVQGPHVVPDANSGCSTPFIPDGNSSISAQIFPDGNSSCSQIFIDSSACLPPARDPATETKAGEGGGGGGGGGGSGGGGDAKSGVVGVTTLVVPGGKSVPVPDGVSALTVPEEVLGGEDDHDSEGKVDSPKDPKSPSKLDNKGGSSPVISKVVPSVTASKAIPSGISALALLGGNFTSFHHSTSPQRRSFPSPIIEERASCASSPFMPMGGDRTPSVKSRDVFNFTPDVVVEVEAVDDEIVDSGSGEESCETMSPDDQSLGDQISTSSSSYAGGAEINILSPMLGLPDSRADFASGSLSPRDMIDICEERIYSDYKHSLEMGGVDDLIITDAKLDVAEEEIIVAVKSRRNSWRKENPRKAAEKDGGDSSKNPDQAGGAGGSDEFAAALSAALTASVSDRNGHTGPPTHNGEALTEQQPRDSATISDSGAGVS